MKVVINKCFGGFGLSARAVKRLAELNGRECYFFTHQRDGGGNLNLHSYRPVSLDEADSDFLFFAFDIPNPNEVLRGDKDWHAMSIEDRQQENALYESHSLGTGREIDRGDPKLVQVIEELGDAANGAHAQLAIVEIPDGVEYTVEEYDGSEHIAEAHRTWR
jgi:hypothetical protein